jgi:hypothetical protein
LRFALGKGDGMRAPPPTLAPLGTAVIREKSYGPVWYKIEEMIFVSYSHADAGWCKDLVIMAAPLVRYGGMQYFADTDIAAGSSWPSTIHKALDKAAVAVLLVSRHFFASQFIMQTELPYILKARNDRGLVVLWVLVSDCLYKNTPLKPIQAALPTKEPLEAMSKAGASAALKTLCEKIEDVWMKSEHPKLNLALHGKKVQQKMIDLKILASPARRRTEIFVRADNTPDWYHQGPILQGHETRTCHFGSATTKPNTGFHIMAMTTDLPVPHQGGKPTNPLPKARTWTDPLRVIRA